MKLTNQQQRFVEEYLIDLNASDAAIRAGYKHRQCGRRLMTVEKVVAAIQEAKAERSQRTRVNADYVVNTILETIERCRQAEPVLDRNGEQVIVSTPTGELAPAFVFDAKSVLKGCELLGKHLGMFVEKKEISGPNGGPIQQQNVTPEELAEAVKSVRDKF